MAWIWSHLYNCQVISSLIILIFYLKKGNTSATVTDSWQTCSCNYPVGHISPCNSPDLPLLLSEYPWRTGDILACLHMHSILELYQDYFNNFNDVCSNLPAHSFSRYKIPSWADLKFCGDDLLVSSDNLHNLMLL